MAFAINRYFAGLLIVSFCFSFLPAQGRDRQYLNRFWQTDDGMPSNVVTAVARDSEGFLWIGTGAGVTCFDGWRFKTYGSEDGLPNTQIYSLHFDRAGRLWAGTRTGVAWWDGTEWHSVPEMSLNWIFAIGESPDGSIWFGTYTGCWRWRDGVLEAIEFGGKPPDVRGFLPDVKDGLFILTRNHIYHWEPAASNIAMPVPGPWDSHDLRGLARDAEGRMLVCGSGLLLRENNGSWEDLAATMPSGTASSILSCAPAPDGALWIGTRDIGTMVLEDGTWSSVNTTNGKLSLDDVRCVVVDEEGLVWVGTNGGGLNRLRRQLFESYSFEEGLGRTVTSALTIGADGTVWAGTDGGALLRLSEGRFVPEPKWHSSSEGQSIWSLCGTRDGSLWIGTYRSGLFRMTDGVIAPVPANAVGTKSYPTVSAFFETQNSDLLVGVKDDLPSPDRSVQLWSDSVMDSSFPEPGQPGLNDNLVVHDLLESRDGAVWAACNWDGLWKKDANGWTRPEFMPNGLPLNPVTLFESADGSIWIGTAGQGLLRNREGVFTRWTVSEGLLSDSVVQVLEDQMGDIWIGTDSGLQRLDRSGLEAGPVYRIAGLRIGREDGLPTPQFTGDHGTLCALAADGTMWFSLASGAIHIDPTRFADVRPPEKPHIESIETDRGTIWHRNGSASDKPVEVAAGSGGIRITFTSPEFIAPERMRFQYRMSGIDQDWQTTEGSRSASYGSLSPGRHRFEIRVLGGDGALDSAPKRIELQIEPYFWQRLDFRIVIGFFLASLLAWIVRGLSLQRARRKIKTMRMERRIEKERARIARDLHDDLGASLTEINFLGTLVGRSIEEGNLKDKIAAIVDRARSMAKSLDEIVWTVSPENDTLNSTAYYLVSRVRESLDTLGIRCRLTVPDSLPAIPLDSNRRHNLLMTVNEAINNAIKHSGTSEVRLLLQFDARTFQVVIADNGCGFTPDVVPLERNGLRNMRQRMESVGGICNISSTESGTTVSIEIPLTNVPVL